VNAGTAPPGLPAATLAALQTRTPLLWLNPGRVMGTAPPLPAGLDTLIDEAEQRFERARVLLARLFPEMSDGVVDSPLRATPALQAALGLEAASGGRLLLKADHLLPVAGSIKARGGFHEVIAHAESLALAAGLLQADDDLAALASPAARALFAQRTVAVGSTGNLGLSIGTLAAALGFKAVVHMSAEAKAWKKAALRARGAEVIEHAGDYAEAVAAGRREAEADPHSYFVDDERSPLLLAGYAAAARPLAAQLRQLGVVPSARAPLFVYLPCGVGGAPGGIALGLARCFGAAVHCFFAEPVASACMLLRLAEGEGVSVYDHGLDNRTLADGLAVPRASDLVATLVAPVVSGVFTVTDEQLCGGLLQAWEAERFEIEPSAAAGFPGPLWLGGSEAGQGYLAAAGLEGRLPAATHLVWTTGGCLQPAEEHTRLRALAQQLETA
jgi:D-serine dehydratase